MMNLGIRGSPTSDISQPRRFSLPRPPTGQHQSIRLESDEAALKEDLGPKPAQEAATSEASKVDHLGLLALKQAISVAFTQRRANLLLHVLWHRQLTVSAEEVQNAIEVRVPYY
ncbi:unnamed protein product [Protopolystoma xenopodis]|uniref:Uncharacterized protein n=1 Tax=Protopolystoma xenopodis TaxID=117903 RepID=A0A448XPR8_9PLAT|nr:unnamed protein product [Protopolystoma xenopodis]